MTPLLVAQEKSLICTVRETNQLESAKYYREKKIFGNMIYEEKAKALALRIEVSAKSSGGLPMLPVR